MAIALVTGDTASGDVNTATSSALDSAGANLLIIGQQEYTGIGIGSIGDSKSNSYSALTEYKNNAFTMRSIMHYSLGGTVGSGHTATDSGSIVAPAVNFAAFSGVKASSALDQQNGGIASSSLTAQPGTVTPTEDDELIVAVLTFNVAGAVSIDSGFTIIDQVENVSSNNVGGAIAYKIQNTAGSENPTWTLPISGSAAASIATFKAQPGGGTQNSGMFFGA